MSINLYQDVSSIEDLEKIVRSYRHVYSRDPEHIVIPTDWAKKEGKIPTEIGGVLVILSSKLGEPPTGHAYVIHGESDDPDKHVDGSFP